MSWNTGFQWGKGGTYIKPVVKGGKYITKVPVSPITASYTLDGSTPSSVTQWLGSLSLTADAANGSAVLTNATIPAGIVIGAVITGLAFLPTGTTVIAFDLVLKTVTISNASTINATANAFKLTDPSYTVGVPSNGFFKWDENLYGVIRMPINPGHSAGDTTLFTGTIQILDGLSNVLTQMSMSASVTVTGNLTSGSSITTFNAFSMGTEQFSTFNGVNFSWSGSSSVYSTTFPSIASFLSYDPNSVIRDI